MTRGTTELVLDLIDVVTVLAPAVADTIASVRQMVAEDRDPTPEERVAVIRLRKDLLARMRQAAEQTSPTTAPEVSEGG